MGLGSRVRRLPGTAQVHCISHNNCSYASMEMEKFEIERGRQFSKAILAFVATKNVTGRCRPQNVMPWWSKIFRMIETLM